MSNLISKSDLVAEIERRIKTNKECMLGLRNLDYYQGKVDALNDTISFINSLQKEPKECMYSKDNYTDEDRKVLFGDCEEECEFNKKEEPVSEDLFEASAEYAATGEILANGKEMIDFQKQKTFIAGAEWQKAKDESTTEDLGDYINKLSKQFPEVSFAKLSRIAVRVSKWQKANLWKPADGNDLLEYDKEVIVLTQPYPLGGNEYAVYFAHRPNPDGWDGKSLSTGKVEHYIPKTYGKSGWNIPDIKWWLDVELPKEIEL